MFSRASFGEAPFAAEPVTAGGGAPFTLLPALGLLVLTGFAPAIGQSVTITPATGEVTLTAFAPKFPTTIVTGEPGGPISYGDTTVDTNGTNLTAHTPTGPSPGSSWTNAYGGSTDVKIYGNEITYTAGGYAHTHKVFEVPGGYTSDDYDAEADFTFWSNPTDNWQSITVRGSSSDRIAYEFGWYTDTWYYKYNNGTTRADVQSTSYPLPSSGTVKHVRVNVVGTTLRFYVDEILTFTVTGATELSSGKAGVYFVGQSAHAAADTGVQISNFEVTFDTGGSSLALTGFAPTITVITVGFTLNPGLGALDLTGFSPTLGLPRTIVPGVGALTLDGFSPKFPRTILPGSGALVLTGNAPSIGLPKTIVPGFGQLTLTGFSPQFAKTVVPGSGALSLTGFGPTIGLPYTLRPALGQLALTGFGPSLSFVFGGFNLQPGLGALSLTGFSPVIGLPRTLSPDVGVLDLTGFAPRFPLTVIPDSGVLTLSGLAPTIYFTPPGVTLELGTGQLTLTGYAPQFGSFTFRIRGGPVMTAHITAGGVLVASITGGPTFTGTIGGGPV